MTVLQLPPNASFRRRVSLLSLKFTYALGPPLSDPSPREIKQILDIHCYWPVFMDNYSCISDLENGLSHIIGLLSIC